MRQWAYALIIGAAAALAGAAASLSDSMAAGNQKMQTHWKSQALGVGIQRIIAALGTTFSGSELEQARRTYTEFFRHDLTALGDVSPTIGNSIFEETVERKLAELKMLSVEQRREMLERDSLVARVIALDDEVRRAGEELIEGKRLTPQDKASIIDACNKLNALSQEANSNPQVASRVGQLVSESLLDCRFILEGGDPTSLRLSKYKDYTTIGSAPAGR
jgi:hypothetical protein